MIRGAGFRRDDELYDLTATNKEARVGAHIVGALDPEKRNTGRVQGRGCQPDFDVLVGLPFNSQRGSLGRDHDFLSHDRLTDLNQALDTERSDPERYRLRVCDPAITGSADAVQNYLLNPGSLCASDDTPAPPKREGHVIAC